MEFIGLLEKYILDNGLFTRKDKLLIAVSGGVDSIVLAHSLYQLGYYVGLAHCNFQLRGEESEKDAAFVKVFAGKLAVPFYSKRFDVTRNQNVSGGSIQMVARELRYNWFEKIRSENNFDFILTAHHQNDGLETVLLNLVRGTGLAGFHGILPKSRRIARPLLFASKEMIESFAKESRLEWREDISNESNKYKRNLIRNKVVPILKDINPSVEKTFQNSADQIILTVQFLSNQIDLILPDLFFEENGYTKFDIKVITQHRDGLFLLNSILKEFGFSFLDTKNIFQSANSVPGKLFFSPSHRLLKDRDFWIIDTLLKTESVSIIINSGCSRINLSENFYLDIETKKGGFKDLNLLKSKNTMILDFEKIEFPIKVRNWEQGDQFSPLGMKGSKLVSDHLTDLKFNLFEKERILLLEIKGKIAGILPDRPSNDFSVTTQTETLFIIRVKSLLA